MRRSVTQLGQRRTSDRGVCVIQLGQRWTSDRGVCVIQLGQSRKAHAHLMDAVSGVVVLVLLL